jgi:peptide deformylase
MALFNPKLTVHRPQDKIAMSESCLSVPGTLPHLTSTLLPHA